MTVMSIDNALVTQFSDMVHIEAQQTKSRLRDKVIVKRMTGDDFAYDSLGALEAVEVTSRNQATVGQDITHSRRQIRTKRFTVTLLIDPKDDVSVLIDPEKEYAKQVAHALSRQFDRVAVDSAFADISTGRNFGTTVTYLVDSGYTPVDATSGLTYEKLLEIHKNFIDADVGNDMPESFYLTITGDEHDSLMKEAELTSGDFTRALPVDGGRIMNAAGFDLVQFAHVAADPDGKNILNENAAGTEKLLIAATTRGLVVGVSKEMNIRVDERPDLNYSKQVFAEMIIGAVRSEGKLIQQVRVAV